MLRPILTHRIFPSSFLSGSGPSCLARRFCNQPKSFKPDVSQIPTLDEFLRANPVDSNHKDNVDVGGIKPLMPSSSVPQDKNFYLETYGCQMNVADSEIVTSILKNAGFHEVKTENDADVVLINTCSIRENAETKVWRRLEELNNLRKKRSTLKKDTIIGLLGCMAERLKTKLVEDKRLVDVIAGPDAYRDLPHLIQSMSPEQNAEEDFAMNVQLSLEETYADIRPTRMNPNSISAFLTIMRGCNNMCSFCVVPFTRGRERSRTIGSIIDEVKWLRDQNVKEITFLGQNVNSYHDTTTETSISSKHSNSAGFSEMFRLREGSGYRFADLLEQAAIAAPEVRFRFTSPHPKDFPDPVLQAIQSFNNICKNIHMPAQSGNTNVLTRMRRFYTREAYLELVSNIKSRMPGLTLSSDFICGFCGETEEEFQDTLSLLDIVKYELGFLFAYSLREKTYAHRNLADDVPPEVKQDRLTRMIDCFHKNQLEVTQEEIGRHHIVLVEGYSKDGKQLKGRTDTNRVVIFPENKLPGKFSTRSEESETEEVKPGDYVVARIERVTSKTLFGNGLGKTKINDFFALSNNSPFFVPPCPSSLAFQ